MIYFYYYSIFNFLNVEDEFKEFEKIFKVTFEINEVEILYLETLGCLSSEKGIILGARLQKQIEKGYKIDYEHNTYFKELNKKLEANRINQLFLTPLGWFIAILNLRKYYTYINIKLDLKSKKYRRYKNFERKIMFKKKENKIILSDEDILHSLNYNIIIKEREWI